MLYSNVAVYKIPCADCLWCYKCRRNRQISFKYQTKGTHTKCKKQLPKAQESRTMHGLMTMPLTLRMTVLLTKIVFRYRLWNLGIHTMATPTWTI